MAAIGSFWQLGLIGWPVGHSLSPVMHSAALKSAGLKGDYRLFPVPPLPGGASGLRDLLDEMRHGNIHGLNVTIPHKQSVLSLMDELTPAAQAIGAVNTISMNGRLKGDNTDWLGFSRDLAAQLPDNLPVAERCALVLGAGGSARAIVYALVQSGWQVNISARRSEQSGRMAADLSTPQNRITAVPLPDFSGLSAVRLIVNTTPAGMSPFIEETPWPSGLPFPENALLYDLIYNPLQTKLMRAAAAAGLLAVNGLGMLIEQAALAFHLWTGQSITSDIFKQAALERKSS
jgi:shikimate dehydrogenase